MKNVLYLCLAITGFTACKKDDYNLYSEGGIIQFGPTPNFLYSVSYEMADTMKPYTFIYQPPSVLQDTVYFDIYALGGPDKQDRFFELKQVELPGKNNAVAGKHYKAFNDPSLKQAFVVKAGEIHANVPIVLLRDASLKDEDVVLQFEVIKNEWFKTGDPTKLWRRVEFSDQISQPAAWNAVTTQSYWGKYSKVKHEFMILYTGEKWDQEFMSQLNSAQANLVLYWRGKLKALLSEYNNAHPNDPLTDEFESLVSFP